MTRRHTSPIFPSGLIIKDIPGYPGYKADSEGYIWGKKGFRLKWQYNKGGYPRVSVSPNSKQPIHKLVCLAFYGPKPDGLQIRHIDGNKENTRPENFVYGTSRENADDFITHGSGRGSKNGHSKLKEIDIIEMRELYRTEQMNQTELAKKYGVTQSCIFFALEGKRVWKHVPNPCKMHTHEFHRGSKAPRAKLDDKKVIEIRLRIKNNESDIEIAKDYDASDAAIWNIRHRHTYRHVP